MPFSLSVDTEDLTEIKVLLSTIIPVQIEHCWQAVREFGELSAYAPELQVFGARLGVQTSMLVRLLQRLLGLATPCWPTMTLRVS